MRTSMVCILFSMLLGTSGLMGQTNIKDLIHKELSGNYEFVPDDNIYSDKFKTVNNDTGNKKSATEEWGNAPGWVWIKQFGGSAADAGKAVTSDAMGNIYVAGYFSGQVIIGNDTLESQGKADMVVMKLSQTCYPLWIRHVPCSAGESIIPESILLDNSGNLIITGYFDGPTVTIQGTVLNRTGNQDIFITKFNSSGTFTWAKNFGVSEKLLRGSKVRSDAGNNYYIICSEGYGYSKMVKYNASGQLLLDLPKVDCKYFDIEIYNNADIYLTGWINSWAEFGDSILNPGYLEIFLAKSDLNGNFSWAIGAKHTGSYNSSNAKDITVSTDGYVYLLGSLNPNTIWGTDTSKEWDFPFISKISSSGQITWTKTAETVNAGHQYNLLFLDAQNNLNIIGTASDTVIYDGVEIYPSDFVLKCNSDGNGLWSENLDFTPISVNRYGTDKMIATGTDIYGNILASRYSSNAIKEYTSNIKGNSGTGSISGMETDSDANLYSYGTLSGSGEIFGRTFNNFKGCFLSKHNSRGELLWIEFINGASAPVYTLGNSFVLNRNHNCFFLTGGIIDTLEIGDETLFPADGNQFLAKYTSEGVFEWVQPLKGFSTGESSLSTDKLGNVIFSGGNAGDVTIGDNSFTGSPSGGAYIAKFDIDGVLKWVAVISSTNIIYSGIVSTDSDNSIYFTGEFYPGEINFNGTQINTEGDTEGDVLFAKLDPNGNPYWIKTFGRGNSRMDTWPTDLVTDPDGYSYIYGWYGDSVYFDNILLKKPYVPKKYLFNFFISKIDPSGNVIWINSIYEEYWDFNYNEIELDENGNCYVMARFRDTLMFGSDYILPNTGKSDMFIAKYLSNGDLAWVKSIETTTGTNKIQGLAVYDSLSLFTGGYFVNQASFDQVTLNSISQNGFIGLLSQGKLNCMDITSTFSDYVCPGENDGFIDITMAGGVAPYSYKWSNGAVTEDLTNLKSGKYVVNVTDSRLCIVRDTIELDSVVTYQDSELCLVTVNNNNKIIVVWEKAYDKDIAFYRLYREKTKNNYIKIADIPFNDLSVYVDEASTPEEFSHYYKIKAIDLCGNESEISGYHKSIHLWSSVGISGEVTLTWDEYEGFEYGEYKIFRGSSLNDLTEIRTISSSSMSWTDPDPPSGQVYYRVEVVKPEPCFPTSNKALEYGSTVSNYDEETIEAIIPYHSETLSIYPNPFKDKTIIAFPNPDNSSYRLVITDLTGKIVIVMNHIIADEVEIDRANLQAGLYIVELRGKKFFRAKLIVE